MFHFRIQCNIFSFPKICKYVSVVNEGQRGVELEVVGLFLENVFFLTIKILQIKLYCKTALNLTFVISFFLNLVQLSAKLWRFFTINPEIF